MSAPVTTTHSQTRQSRQERESPRPFQHAPIVQPDEDDNQPEDGEKRSKTRKFLRAIGLSCLFKSGRGARRSGANPYPTSGRRSRQNASGPALRAITIEDARYAFQNNVLDSDDGMSSVYSSHYGGGGGGNPYVLFLGSEKQDHLRPRFQGGESELADLKTLRPSMQDRQLPVFFTPPPSEGLRALTPRRKSFYYHDSPPDSPVGVFA